VMAQPERITRDDIEAKFREIKGDIDETAEAAKPIGIAAGAIALIAVVGVAYLIGRRRERKRRTVVEIRRV
jgi:hypothetical protein